MCDGEAFGRLGLSCVRAGHSGVSPEKSIWVLVGRGLCSETTPSERELRESSCNFPFTSSDFGEAVSGERLFY
jgi:hypothetical protein